MKPKTIYVVIGRKGELAGIRETKREALALAERVQAIDVRKYVEVIE